MGCRSRVPTNEGFGGLPREHRGGSPQPLGDAAGVEETLGAMLSSSRASLSEVPPHRTGPRSNAVIGAAEDHVGAIGGPWCGGPALISQLRGIVDRWASSADSHAGDLYSPESTLRQPVDTPEQAEDHTRALDQVEAVQWLRGTQARRGQSSVKRSAESKDAQTTRRTTSAGSPTRSRSTSCSRVRGSRRL